jgi:DNA-binding response OmpR family regulator
MNGKLVLIADDEPDILKILEHHLTPQGWLVTTVEDGMAATLKAKEIKPDIMIIDIKMPGAYGTTVFQTLREDAATKNVPVLFISGMLPEEALRKRIAADARNEYLAKPFALKEVDAALKRLLGEHA